MALDSFNDHFPNLSIFYAAKFFSPKHYLVDELDIGTLTEQWLNQLVTHFRWSDDSVNQCNAKLLEFVEMLSSICEHQGVHKIWIFCDND